MKTKALRGMFGASVRLVSPSLSQVKFGFALPLQA
jgi:hypothetical protein